MKQEANFIFVILLFLLVPFQNLFGQNNLKVEFESPTAVPNFLNICGDPDTATVKVSLDGLSPDARQNIIANLELFKGVELVEFLAGASSAGVTLNDISNPNQPIFGLPDLDPSGTTFVDISFSIAAKCEYIDTLNANNAIQVENIWNFNYDLSGTPLTESDVNTEYRDAFAVPSFTTVVNNTHGPARAGECFSRDVVITNSGLDGFVDEIIYTNTQGKGIYVTSIEVNGAVIPVTKTMLVTGDTLIEATIDGSYFMANTVGAGLGDSDGFFDPNETVTVTENICVLNCLDSKASLYDISWGCDGRYCNTISTSDFIQVGQGDANVRVEDSGSTANVFAGYCQDGLSTVTFTNNGVEVDAGFGAMLNLETGIGLGNTFQITDGGYTVTEITVAGIVVPLVGAMYTIDNNPLFATDPDGVGSGLEDLDNDGFFDDLGVGASFELTANYEIDCSIAESLGLNGDCANDYGTSFSARVDYDNACQNRIVRLRGNYFRPNNQLSRAETSSDSDAFVEQDTFYIYQLVDRSTSRFEKNCNGQEEFQVKVVLPAGVMPIVSEIEMTRNGGTLPIPFLSNNIVNDTLFLVFDAASIPYITGKYEVKLAFVADCSAALDFVEFPYEFAFNCPPCDCRHIWHCDTLQGPKLHAEMPPCPPLTFVCPVGVATKSFDVNRTTFGFTDATYTTPFDENLANKKVAISCDSVEMRIMNVVGDTPIADSLGMIITYINPDGEIDSTQTFLFNTGVVRFTNGGTEYFCNIDTTILSIQTIDSLQILNFDLHDCLTGLGLTLIAGDTIEYLGNFSINADGPYPTAFTTVPNFRGYGYATVDGVEESCDNFGEIFDLAKNQTVVNFPSSSAFPEGCQEKNLNFNLLTVNNGFTEWFGQEYRQAIGIDSIVIDYDPAILESFGQLATEISIPGHPIHGDNYYAVQGFEVSDNGHYVAQFDTLQSVPALNNVQSYSFSFRIRVIPNCQSELGSSDGDNRYNFDPQIYYQDRFYATVIGDGSCAEQKAESADSDIYYTDSPELNLTTASNPNFNLAGDTAYWDLQLCNNSFVGAAGLTWFSIEDPSGAIEVISMEDITDATNVIPLTVNPYGTAGSNYFAYTNELQTGNATATFDDICNVVRVKALVNNCGSTDFSARVGWNCIAYKETNWNPELYPPCEDETLVLNVTTLDPALDATIVQQPTVDPNICDTNTIAILLRNTNLGTAFNVRTQIILPMQGASILPGSVELAYPSGAAFQAVATDPVFVETTTRGDVYEYADFSNLNTFLDQNGLPGFDALNPTDSNEMIIRYKFLTSCDFMSGSISYYAFQGIKNCGDSTNYETGETLPIEIDGGAAGLNKIFDIQFSEASVLIPNASAPLEITVTNLTNTPTDDTDLVSLLLPENVVYDLNTTLATLPMGWVLPEPVVEVDGSFQRLTWEIPNGLLQGDSTVFSFSVTSPNVDCSIMNLEAGLNTIERKMLNCEISSTICDVDAITSINDGALTNLPVRQNTLSFVLNNVVSNCTGANEETIQFSAAIQNNGTDFPNLPIDVEYYFDTDGSGSVTVGDPLLTTITESGPIAANAALLINHSIPVTNNQICGIIVRIDSTGLGICEIAEVPLGEPHLLNAGNDQIFCETAPTTITANLGDPTCGSITNYTFNWRAISPASTSNLSATDIPDPVLTINHNAMVQDTLQYILETNRPSCSGITRDTVSIIRALGITVDPGPIVFVQNGGSTTLSPTVNGTAPFTYDWSPTATLDNSTSSNPIASPTGDTDYMVTITSASGCTGEATVQVRIGGAVTISVEPYDTTICAENMVSLTASGGTNFIWEEGDSNPTTGNLSAYNIPNPVFENGLAGSTYNYDVIVEDMAFPGFFDTANIVIQTLATPEVVINSSSASFICRDEELTLTATGANTYVWENVTNGSQIGTNPIITVMPSIETNYQVTGMDTSGCVGGDQITIGVNEAAVAEIFSLPSSGCSGDSVLLFGGTGTSMEWLENGSFVGTGDSIYVQPTETSTYTLIVENVVGCQDTTDILISVSPCPCDPIEVESIVTVETTCGNNTGMATLNLVNDPSEYSYTWTPNVGSSVGAGNARTDLPFGGYEVRVQSNLTTYCSETFYVLIQNSDGPDATATTTAATCNAANGTATLLPDTLNFLWENNSTDSVRNDLTAGVHFVTITSPANPNCPNAMIVTVEEDNPLAATLLVNQAPDCGVSNGSATIQVTGGSGNYSYSWASGTATETNLASGMHTVTITDLGTTGCELIYNFILTDNVPPAEVTISTINAASCVGATNGEVNFSVNYGLYNAPADTIITDGTQNFENGNLPAGEYCIIISDAGGCILGGDCFTVESSETLELNIEVKADCAAGGAITVEVQGGTSPYTYDWADLPDSLDIANRIDLAVGIYDLILTDDSGCIVDYSILVPPCDSVIITPSTFCDTIFVGQTDTFFLDISELPGGVVSIDNFCLDSSGTHVEYFEDFNMLGIEYTGLEIGQDSACIQFCDDLGYCDTTYLCVSVVEYLGLPVLVRDCTDSVDIGLPKVINVKANDQIFGGIDTMYISEESLYGLTTLNLDGSITYNASDTYCERLDSFSYVICNPNGCDTASVCVFINCTDIVIFNAVSPNGDRENDVFYIASIEDYPNSVLKIYNRWGNMVYEKVGYENDWSGTFNGNRDLPDGTYYYVLELNDPDDQRVFQGYLEIFR